MVGFCTRPGFTVFYYCCFHIKTSRVGQKNNQELNQYKIQCEFYNSFVICFFYTCIEKFFSKLSEKMGFPYFDSFWVNFEKWKVCLKKLVAHCAFLLWFHDIRLNLEFDLFLVSKNPVCHRSKFRWVVREHPQVFWQFCNWFWSFHIFWVVGWGEKRNRSSWARKKKLWYRKLLSWLC